MADREYPPTEGTDPGSPEFHALMLTRPDLAAQWWAVYQKEPRVFWKHCIRVKDKTFNYIPFDIDHKDYRRCQNRLYDSMMQMWKVDQRIRLTELKPRQLGSTLYWLNVALWIAICVVPASQGFIGADTDTKSEDILARLKESVGSMPEWVRPKLDRNALDRLSFQGWEAPEAVPGRDPARSFLLTGSSKAKAEGRSYMWNIVLFSEAGYYGDKAKDFMSGIKMSVSRQAAGMVVLESTAFGWGGEFHEECRLASAKKNGFKFVFIPWFHVEEYRIDPKSADAQRMKREGFDPTVFCKDVAAGNLTGLDDDERDLVEKFGVTGPQLIWRRWCIASNCRDDIVVFHRDFPSTPDEAFVSTGSPVFDTKALKEIHAKHVRPPLAVGECFIDENGVARFDVCHNGRVKIWQYPTAGVHYLLGCDPAAGSELWSNAEDRPGDNATIEVITRGTREQVAELAGSYPPDVAGEIVLALCLWYHGPVAVIENNSGWGTPIIKMLKDWGYPALYSREEWDTRTNQQVWQLGWCTSVKTRPMMFTTARGRVRSRKLIIHSRELIEEMAEMEFKALPGGGVKPIAKSGKRDDRVTNLAMLLQVDADIGMPADPQQDNPDLIRYDENSPRAFMWGYVNAALLKPPMSHIQ